MTIMLCVFILAGTTCAYANDIGNNLTDDNVNDDIGVNATFDELNLDINNVSGDVYINDDIGVIGTFDELNRDIHNLSSGDVYNIDKDYFFEDKFIGFSSDNPCIIISVDNITINGNGHTIDGNLKSDFFKVIGNNVKIFNLTFINGYFAPPSLKITEVRGSSAEQITYRKTYEYLWDMSPICWLGDNGLLSDCVFLGNSAVNGGAITWMGNNGLINNSKFIENIANGVGGAIYMGGINNTISDVVFINSTSKLSGESIFLDRKHENTTLINPVSYDYMILIDGELFDIDVDYLRYSYLSKVGDKEVNLIPAIYQAIICGIAVIDKDLCCYAQYEDNGDFTLSLLRNFEEYNILYQKNYIFFNTTLNHIFSSVLKDDFQNNVLIAKTLNVTCCANEFAGLSIRDKTINIENVYEYACLSTLDGLIRNTPVMDKVKLDLQELYGSVTIFDNVFGAMASKLSDVEIKTLFFNFNRNAPKDTRKFTGVTYALNVVCQAGKVFNSNIKWNTKNGFDIVNIFGNGAKIQATSGDRDENKWIEPGENQVYMISDLTIDGFNTAICNKKGCCVFDKVIFNNNRMDYIFDRDDGAAILNAASVICNNCTFSNNYAKNGGAIFNQGILKLNNCTFYNNIGYGTGNDVLNVDKGSVYENGEQIKGTAGSITYVESISYWKTALISAVAGIGTFCLALAAGALVFATGGGALLAIGVGVGAGIFSGASLGSIAGYTIASRQYNLAYDRTATASGLILGCIGLGITGGIVGATMVGPKCKMVMDKKISSAREMTTMSADEKYLKSKPEIGTDFKYTTKTVDGQQRLYIELSNGKSYMLGEGGYVVYEGRIVPASDVVIVKEQVIVNGEIKEVSKFCLDANSVWAKGENTEVLQFKKNCVEYEGKWYLKDVCIKVDNAYYPKSVISRIGDSYFLKLPHGETRLLWSKPAPIA